MTTPSEVTQLLHSWSEGDETALERLMPLVFEDLRRIARSFFKREVEHHTLQPTALISEVYLRLKGRRSVKWENRAQFFKFAAELMRRILIDHARARRTVKRGDGLAHLVLDEQLAGSIAGGSSFEALNEALQSLEKVDPRQAQIVELRFFFGLSVDEIAEVLEVSPTTVKREWRTAKFWLYRQLKPV